MVVGFVAELSPVSRIVAIGRSRTLYFASEGGRRGSMQRSASDEGWLLHDNRPAGVLWPEQPLCADITCSATRPRTKEVAVVNPTSVGGSPLASTSTRKKPASP